MDFDIVHLDTLTQMKRKQSNNVLIPEANIHLVEDTESEVNNQGNNVDSEQETSQKGKDKGKDKTKKKKDIVFKWSKRPMSNQKQLSALEAEMTHRFPKHHTRFNVFPNINNLVALVKIIVQYSNFWLQEKISPGKKPPDSKPILPLT